MYESNEHTDLRLFCVALVIMWMVFIGLWRHSVSKCEYVEKNRDVYKVQMEEIIKTAPSGWIRVKLLIHPVNGPDEAIYVTTPLEKSSQCMSCHVGNEVGPRAELCPRKKTEAKSP